MIEKKQSSPLLINEPPLQVLPTLAKLIGLNEALVLQQLQYWLFHEKLGITKNGQKWIYNSYPEWAKNFPFWDKRTIQRIFRSLEKEKLVLSSQFFKNKYNRMKSYRINYDVLNRLIKNIP